MLLKLGGVVVALLVVGYLLIAVAPKLFVGGGSASAWSPFDYLPENAQMVAHVDVDDLRGSDLFSDIRKLVGEQSAQVPQDVDVDNISEVFVAGSGDDSLAVLRTKEDRPLKDMLPKDHRQEPTRLYQNVEYAVVGKSFGNKERVMAKTADRTFCFAPSEDLLKQAIERLAAKRRRSPQRASSRCSMRSAAAATISPG